MSQPTFRRQFADSLAATMVLSIVCSALVWSLSLWLLSREILFRPANYHERQIPGIVAFVQAHHDQVLSPGFRPVLEGIVPLQGMDYQVLDASADLIYGSLQEPLLTSNEVWRRINTQRRVDRRIVDYRPIGDPAGGLRGVFVIVYDLSITGANPSRSWSTSAFAAANMAAPFLFFLMFALIFARRIGKRLEPPVARLIDAADRIRRRDLEFTLAGTVGSKELAEVAGAFEAMRQALRQALIERWRIERERREMVAAITHDLRTPLSVIQGHVDTLLGREDRRADRLERYLQTIRRNAERASHLVQEMSQLVEVDHPGFSLTARPADLVAYFRVKADEYRLSAASAGIAFDAAVRVASGHDGWLNVDVRRLDQILANVLENGLRHTPSGGSLRLQAEIGPEALLIVVEDSGPGFTKRDLDHAFAPFYQGDEARLHRRGEMGLGLYIVKRLAELHGGEATIGNLTRGGAYVRIVLPALPPGDGDR